MGQWKDNTMNGFGKLYYNSKDLAYEGQWYKDDFHGIGKVYNNEYSDLAEPFNYEVFDDLEEEDIYWKSY